MNQQKENHFVTSKRDVAGISSKKTNDNVVLNTPVEEKTHFTEFITTTASLIPCLGPDQKIAQASQDDCDNVWKFWNAQPKNVSVTNTSVNSSNSTASNDTSNTTNNSSSTSTPSPTPTITTIPSITPTPTETQQSTPAITSVEIMACTSSSCGNITTLTIKGKNFPSDTIVQLMETDWGFAYGENTQFNHAPDAMRVGGNGSTILISDFFNLPCDTYMVRLIFPSLDDTASISDTITPSYCN